MLACAAACSSPGERAIDAAASYFAREVTRNDPAWSGIFGHLKRRFGFASRNAAGAWLHAPSESPLYRRLDDPDARVPADTIAALGSAVDRMTAAALHCDRLGLPADWIRALDDASRAGGYALTHAALAAEWSAENGCVAWSALAPLRARQIEGLAALARDWRGLVSGYATPVDLGVEAIAMLYYLGAASRVEPAWVEGLLAMQRPDGGFPGHPGDTRSDPHTTALALWVLLEHERPEAPARPWIVSRDRATRDTDR